MTNYDHIHSLFLFIIIAVLTQRIAIRKRFYHIRTPWSPINISFKQVATIFGIYLMMVFIVVPFFISLTRVSSPLWFNLFLIALLFLYCHTQPKGIFGKIWKDKGYSNASIWTDLGLGFMTWFIAFPVVVVTDQVCNLILQWIYKTEGYDQVAVRYLKEALTSPGQLVNALSLVLMIAPTLEEFLFRGTLQTYLKRWIGAKGAILIASLAFACFHFSPSQGISNLSLIPSLFAFSSFLGFLYEKRASLMAPIGLHTTFNLASSLRILFFSNS